MLVKKSEAWQKLKTKEKEIISIFLKSNNKQKAYFTVYANKSRKNKTHMQQAYNFFKKKHIKMCVDEIEDEANRRFAKQVTCASKSRVKSQEEIELEKNKLVIDVAWVKYRLALLADFNIRKFVKVIDGKFYYDFRDATDEDWYCIQECSNDLVTRKDTNELIAVESIRVKPIDKLQALKLLGTHVEVQAFKDKVEHDVNAQVCNMSVDEYKQVRQQMLDADDV